MLTIFVSANRFTSELVQMGGEKVFINQIITRRKSKAEEGKSAAYGWSALAADGCPAAAPWNTITAVVSLPPLLWNVEYNLGPALRRNRIGLFISACLELNPLPSG